MRISISGTEQREDVAKRIGLTTSTVRRQSRLFLAAEKTAAHWLPRVRTSKQEQNTLLPSPVIAKVNMKIGVDRRAFTRTTEPTFKEMSDPTSSPSAAGEAERKFLVQDALSTLLLDNLGLQSPTTPLLSGSFWMLARSGRTDSFGLAGGGSLGNSQLGMRLRAPISSGLDKSKVSLSIRASTPLSGPGKEVALGVSVAPKSSLPLEVILEHRVRPEKGMPDKSAVMIVVGVSDVPIANRVKMDSYLQAGLIGFGNSEKFVGAQASVRTPLLMGRKARLELGLGAWADKQPGIARVDAGPELVLRLDGQKMPLRIALQWRERVAGNASPGSGPALVLGGDF